jgi:hypothetical protein
MFVIHDTRDRRLAGSEELESALQQVRPLVGMSRSRQMTRLPEGET